MRLPCEVQGDIADIENATIVWLRNDFLGTARVAGRTYYAWQFKAAWDHGNITLRNEHGTNQTDFSLEREGNVRRPTTNCPRLRWMSGSSSLELYADTTKCDAGGCTRLPVQKRMQLPGELPLLGGS